MKKIYTLAVMLFSVGVGICSDPPTKTPGSYKEEVRIAVVNSFDDCSIKPAIYQEFDEGINKVVDLQPLDRDQPYPSFESNNKVVQNFMEILGVNDYVIKSTEVRPLEECGSITTYWLIER